MRKHKKKGHISTMWKKAAHKIMEHTYNMFSWLQLTLFHDSYLCVFSLEINKFILLNPTFCWNIYFRCDNNIFSLKYWISPDVIHSFCVLLIDFHYGRVYLNVEKKIIFDNNHWFKNYYYYFLHQTEIPIQFAAQKTRKKSL